MITIAALLVAAGLAALLFVALGGNTDLARELHETRCERDAMYDRNVTLGIECRQAQVETALWQAEALRLRSERRPDVLDMELARMVRGLPPVGGA